LQFPAFGITFEKFGERSGGIPDWYNLILATALAIPGPAAAQEKEKPDKLTMLATFGQTQLVHWGCFSALSFASGHFIPVTMEKNAHDGPW
jgi:hypothetical protein